MPFALLQLLPYLRRYWRAILEVLAVAALAYGVHRYNLAQRERGAAEERALHAADVARTWATITETVTRQRDSVAARLDTLGHTAPRTITRWRTITAPPPAGGITGDTASAVPIPDSVKAIGDTLARDLAACLTDCAQFRHEAGIIERGLTRRAEVAERRADSLERRRAPLHLSQKATYAGLGALVGALAAAVLHH